MEQPVLRAAVGNNNVQPSRFENPLHFLEHLRGIEETLVPAKYGVKGAFLNHYVINLIFKLVHLKRICDDSLHQASFFVHGAHLLDAHIGYVDIINVMPAVIVHIATHHGVAATQLHNLSVFRHEVVNYGLEAREVFQPIEGLALLSSVPLLPVLSIPIVRHGFFDENALRK